MIQLTEVFCELLRYNGTSNIWLQYSADSIIRDPIKRRTLYNVYKENETQHCFGKESTLGAGEGVERVALIKSLIYARKKVPSAAKNVIWIKFKKVRVECVSCLQYKPSSISCQKKFRT